MSEAKGTKLEEAVSETKGVAEQFVQTLGLKDIIIGGLILYWAKLAYAGSVSALFGTTGYQWVDIALMACAAAFIGKIITSAADMFAATISLILAKTNFLGFYGKMVGALKAYRDSINHRSVLSGDEVDIAASYVIKANPAYRTELESIGTVRTLSYCAFLLTLLYRNYITSQPDPHRFRGLSLTLFILAAAFALIGIIYQFYEIAHLRNILHTLLPTPLDAAAASQAQRVEMVPTQPVQVNVSASEPVRVNLSASGPGPLEVSVKRQGLSKGSMEILIQTEERLKTRNAAQLLTALTIIHQALTLTSDSARGLQEHLNGISHGDQQAGAQIQRLGDKPLQNQDYQLDDILQDIIVQELLKQAPQQRGLELVSLTDGSFRGTIREMMEEVGRWLYRLLPKADDLRPGQNGQEFKATAEEIIKEKKLPDAEEKTARGMMLIGTNQLSQALADSKAKRVEVAKPGEVEVVTQT